MISFNPTNLLSNIIKLQSFSKEEELVSEYLYNVIKNDFKIKVNRFKNNLYSTNKYFDENKFSILLNSHIDTVKPNPGYTNNPFAPIQKDDKLFGLGSNDAGGALIGLLGAFVHYYNEKDLPFNLIFAASAEEEISGKNGIEALYPELPKIDFAIVGEPTLSKIAIAERGLMVLDVKSIGKSGHAAREEGVNAISLAIEDINWFNNFKFPLISEELGPVKMSVTQINAGSQHNVVPSVCDFVVDVRVNDKYSNEEVLNIIKSNIQSEVNARSTRLNSSGVSLNHPIRKVAKELNIETYGSPTMSDQALIPCESIKMGPGDSARSHTADEFIFIKELSDAKSKYIEVISALGKLI